MSQPSIGNGVKFPVGYISAAEGPVTVEGFGANWDDKEELDDN